MKKRILTEEQKKYLDGARVARLATSDRNGTISLVPIVYATKDESIFFVVDKKTKRSAKTLKRIQNIIENPDVTLLVDNYTEVWGDLSYLMLLCHAKIVDQEKEKLAVSSELKKKYAQYGNGGYFPEKLEATVIVKLQPKRAIFWQNLHPSLG